MGSANPKSIKALRWAAMEEGEITAAAVVKHKSEDHKIQLYISLALLCKGSALATVKNTEVNNGLGEWRGLNSRMTSTMKVANGCSTCHSRKVPSRPCSRLKEARDGNNTTVAEHKRIQPLVVLYLWISRCWVQTKARKAKARRGAKAKPQSQGAHEGLLVERERQERERHHISPESHRAACVNTTTEPPITGMLRQSVDGVAVPADLARWLYSVTKREPSREDFLIDLELRHQCAR